jgi:hypothetical protein
VTTLDRLGQSTSNMLPLADELKAQKVNLRVLNLGGGNVDTGTPMGSMVFTVMAALAQMELEVERERVNDSNTKRRTAGWISAVDDRSSAIVRSPTPGDLSNRDNPHPTSPGISVCHGQLCTGAYRTSTLKHGCRPSSPDRPLVPHIWT